MRLVRPPGLLLLAVTIVVHVILCLPGLHEPTVGHSAGDNAEHNLHEPAQPRLHMCDLGHERAAPGVPVDHDHDHHAGCADAAALDWSAASDDTKTVCGALLAPDIASSMSSADGAAGSARGSPETEPLPSCWWLRRSLGGALLAGAWGISRT